MNLLEFPIFARMRQSHAIEHATVHLLSQRDPSLRLVGRSDDKGFYIYGLVSTEMVRHAAEEALRRLQAGEAYLAIHPNCGTNIAAAGTLAGLAALLASAGRRRSFFWDRLPSAITAATLALFLAQPLGYLLQARVTTLAQVEGVRIGQITRQDNGYLVMHQVNLERGKQAR
ncbi:MAG: hypothetical protein IT330_17535 [Anaerolineae bacterium]|nr:hypothetical protein [Anaerolineae bacterium]